MIKEVLYKLDNLHDFVEDCIESGSVSLIDKDIILQNLRDLYVAASTMPLSDDVADGFLDDFEEEDNENVVIFNDTKVIESAAVIYEEDDDNDNVVTAEESISEEYTKLNKENSDNKIESFDEVTSEIDQSSKEISDQLIEEAIAETENTEEEVVYLSLDDNLDAIYEQSEENKSLVISEDSKINITNELFGGDSGLYEQFINKLEAFEDFDEAIIYVYETFIDKQDSDSVSKLADIISEKLNN